MMNLALDDNNDIFADGYALARVDEKEQIAQRIKTRLQLFFGEWFLDRGLGVPWLQEILIKNPRAAVVQGALKQAIINTPDVVALLDFTITDSDTNRAVTVRFSVQTAAGTITDNLEVGA
jgi:hypothetical protein